MGVLATREDTTVLIVNSPNPTHVTLLLEDTMAGQLLRMYAKGAELRGESPERCQFILSLADKSEALCRRRGTIPMRWNAVAPVIMRAPAKTKYTRQEVDTAVFTLKSTDSPAMAQMVEDLARAAGVE